MLTTDFSVPPRNRTRIWSLVVWAAGNIGIYFEGIPSVISKAPFAFSP